MPEEADRLLAVIEARAATGQTGAVWQRRALAALEPQPSSASAPKLAWPLGPGGRMRPVLAPQRIPAAAAGGLPRG